MLTDLNDFEPASFFHCQWLILFLLFLQYYLITLFDSLMIFNLAKFGDPHIFAIQFVVNIKLFFFRLVMSCLPYQFFTFLDLPFLFGKFGWWEDLFFQFGCYCFIIFYLLSLSDGLSFDSVRNLIWPTSN